MKDQQPPFQNNEKEGKNNLEKDFYMDNKDNYKESLSDLQNFTKSLENNENINNRETCLTENEKKLKKDEDIKLNKKRGRSEEKKKLNDSKNRNLSLKKFLTEKENHMINLLMELLMTRYMKMKLILR